MSIFTEVMRAEFPEEEMADRTFRDKVRENIVYICTVHYRRWQTGPSETRSERTLCTSVLYTIGDGRQDLQRQGQREHCVHLYCTL